MIAADEQRKQRYEIHPSCNRLTDINSLDASIRPPSGNGNIFHLMIEHITRYPARRYDLHYTLIERQKLGCFGETLEDVKKMLDSLESEYS